MCQAKYLDIYDDDNKFSTVWRIPLASVGIAQADSVVMTLQFSLYAEVILTFLCQRNFFSILPTGPSHDDFVSESS
jgi:hypothetical protein